MSQELLARIPSQQAILAAEQARQHGKFSEVKRLVGSIEELTQADLSLLPTLDTVSQSSLLQAARIDVVASTTDATAPYFAPQAYRRLSHALQVRHQLYDNESVSSTAQGIQRDASGRLYEFYREMQRDSARLLFAVYEVTQNPIFLRQGIEILEEALEQTRRDPYRIDDTIAPLLRFELVRAQRKQWGDQPDSMEFQHGFYQSAFRAATRDGNYERAATIAVWEMIDAKASKAAGSLNLAEQTLADFQHAIPPEYHHILEDQFRKAEAASLHQKTWGATRRFVSREDTTRIMEQVAAIPSA